VWQANPASLADTNFLIAEYQMDLKILSIHGKGDYSKEYVVLRAINDCSLNFYALADTTFFGADHISSRLRNFFWFPDVNVNAGSIIVLFTRPGTDSSDFENGRVIHRIYWNLNRAVWNNTGDAAVLFSINSWNSTGMK
jgi:hypothetical protein